MILFIFKEKCWVLCVNECDERVYHGWWFSMLTNLLNGYWQMKMETTSMNEEGSKWKCVFRSWKKVMEISQSTNSIGIILCTTKFKCYCNLTWFNAYLMAHIPGRVRCLYKSIPLFPFWYIQQWILVVSTSQEEIGFKSKIPRSLTTKKWNDCYLCTSLFYTVQTRLVTIFIYLFGFRSSEQSNELGGVSNCKELVIQITRTIYTLFFQ